jgi:LCP family protein required for cell wall assembly
MARINLKMAKPRPGARRFTLIWMGICLVLAIALSVILFNFIRNMVEGWAFTPLPGEPVDVNTANNGTPDPSANSSNASEQFLMPSGDVTQKVWDGTSRVNVLVMGLDFRDWQAQDGPPRTDTMMLLTIDPLTMTAGMLSIPRDMWVNIPGFDYGKINTAYALGEAYKIPGGGPALAAKTVEELIGVPVNYYAQVDFYAFEKFIDDIGCLDVKVRQTLRIDPIGKDNAIVLQPGTQPLCGAAVLGYVRMRYTNGGDFDRAQRQQDIIIAIRQQIVHVKTMQTLISQAPKIYADIKDGVRTNMTPQEAISLGLLAQKIPIKSIKKGVIGPPDQVTFGQSPDGLEILKPIPDKIRLLRDEIFTASGPVSPAAKASDFSTLVRSEQARIQLQNGSSTPGLANRTGEYLKSLGLNVVDEANSNYVSDSNGLVIYNGKPYTASYFAQLMKIPTANITIRYDPNSQVDIAIILGNNWANNNPMN